MYPTTWTSVCYKEIVLNCRFCASQALFVALSLTSFQSLAEVPQPVDQAYPSGALKIAVDATDVRHRVFTVHETIPTRPGELTLLYPKWVPGTHAPNGPIDRLAGLEVSAGGKPLVWIRDTLDPYAFHLTVPRGVDAIEVSFQFLSPVVKGHGRIVMTPAMLDLQWNTVSLYPAGYDAKRIRVEASVTYPAGWQSATALEVARKEGDTVVYAPLDYDDLVDSPIYAGKYFRQFDLDPGAAAPVRLNVFADDPKYLNIPENRIAPYKAMVQQMYRLYGSRHFDHYDFLLAISDKLSSIGREHHRSSELGTATSYFDDGNTQISRYEMLPHEFNHSWNGKYRRGADQDTRNLNEPLQDGSLWLYEGQTKLMGYVLAARSGLWSQEQARAMIAEVAAVFDGPGSGLVTWRSVRDTTNDPAMLADASSYYAYQGSYEFYRAGMMIWLDVDGKIRELSKGKRSLDDFCKLFFGMGNGESRLNPYTFEDVVKALDTVAPFDWSSYLRARLDGRGPWTDGLTSHGWKLAYSDTPAAGTSATLPGDFTYSIGMSLGGDGTVNDVVWGRPAFVAGIAPAMKIVSVDGKPYASDTLVDAIRKAQRDKTAPITLAVDNAGESFLARIDYHDGLKYPHLVRSTGKDTLSDLLAPRAEQRTPRQP